MPLPCLTCRHRGPVWKARTTCRARTTDALAEWLEALRGRRDAEVGEVQTCPEYGREVRG